MMAPHDGKDRVVVMDPAQARPVGAYDKGDDAFSPVRAAAAEFLGSLAWAYIAIGVTSNPSFLASGPILNAALAFGFSLFAISFAIGHISGAHLNPIVTLAFMASRKTSWIRGTMYLVAQMAGWLTGVGLVRATQPDFWQGANIGGVRVPNCFGMTSIADELQMTVGRAFLAEFILSFIFLMVVCAATDEFRANRIAMPLAIGMAFFVLSLCGIPMTGGSMNPFRSFASSAVGVDIDGCNPWANHWLYWVAPIAGAIVSAWVYDLTFYNNGIRGMRVFSGDFNTYILGDELVAQYRAGYFTTGYPELTKKPAMAELPVIQPPAAVVVEPVQRTAVSYGQN